MNPQNIPAELKARRQWVLFRVENGKKSPMAVRGGMASPTDPETWSTWEDVEPLIDPPTMWPAFCFTKDDPYVFIDMDEVKQRPNEPMDEYVPRYERATANYGLIMQNIPSYWELSASGKGVHVIAKGHVGPGTRRDGVEIYDRDRFCIFTGDGTGEIIEADEEALNSLLTRMRMGRETGTGTSLPQTKSDEEVLVAIADSHRGTLFAQGEVNTLMADRSQSEVDHEFIAMLTEESGNFDQVNRIFQNSAFSRPKSTAKYVEYSFEKVRGRLEADQAWITAFQKTLPWDAPNGHTVVVEPQVNHNGHSGPSLNGHTPLSAAREVRVESTSSIIPPARMLCPLDPELVPTPLGDKDMGARLLSAMPDGLLKRLSMAFYKDSRYPLAEVSMMAALQVWVMAVSRGYQAETGTALNLYMLLLAVSSAGKSPMVDGAPGFVGKLGGKFVTSHWSPEARSAPALTKQLQFSPRAVMLKQECGSWMQAMTDDKAQPWEKGVSDAFTSLYSAGSGVWSPARIADSENKDLEPLMRPCLSIFGETQPGILWKSIREQGTIKGFLPRFMVLEVDNQSVQIRFQTRQGYPAGLIQEMRDLFVEMARRDSENGPEGTYQTVKMEPEAFKLYEKYTIQCREFLVQLGQEEFSPQAFLYGKMAENAVKLSTLAAISREWRNPNLKVQVQDWEWAVEMVNHSARTMVSKLSEVAQEATVPQRREVVGKWLAKFREMSWEEKQKPAYHKYFKHSTFLERPDLIPVGMLRNVVEKTGAFKECRNPGEFDALLKQMAADGEIVRIISKEDMLKSFQVQAACVVV